MYKDRVKDFARKVRENRDLYEGKVERFFYKLYPSVEDLQEHLGLTYEQWEDLCATKPPLSWANLVACLNTLARTGKVSWNAFEIKLMETSDKHTYWYDPCEDAFQEQTDSTLLTVSPKQILEAYDNKRISFIRDLEMRRLGIDIPLWRTK